MIRILLFHGPDRWGISMKLGIFLGVTQTSLGITFFTKVPQSPRLFMINSTATADKIFTTRGFMQIN